MMNTTTVASPINQSQSDLASRYRGVRHTTETLCRPLSPEDQMVQSMPDASPSKWHQAHTTWFFETFILSAHVSRYRPFDQRYAFLFNSYYKRLGGHPVRAQRGLWSRPTLAQVQQYRCWVDEHMLRFLEDGIPDSLIPLVELGLNHEQQHQELIITDIKHALWTNPLRPAYRDQSLSSRPVAPSMSWFEHEGGLQECGHVGTGFAYDNETPRHSVFLRPFRIASRLITNGEYVRFIEDGGYQRPELWLSEGWDTVNFQQWSAPLYWEHRDGTWFVYTLNGEQKIELTEPVCHVSYFEADAYARWAGFRLPTESEWESAAAPLPVTGNLLDSERFHPIATSSSVTPQQFFGDVWEWTASQYTPYPGFHPAEGAVGEYNGKFMCNQFVLRGGSCATPAGHIRASYRNFFPPAARWQFTGIRLAHD